MLGGLSIWVESKYSGGAESFICAAASILDATFFVGVAVYVLVCFQVV